MASRGAVAMHTCVHMAPHAANVPAAPGGASNANKKACGLLLKSALLVFGTVLVTVSWLVGSQLAWVVSHRNDRGGSVVVWFGSSFQIASRPACLWLVSKARTEPPLRCPLAHASLLSYHRRQAYPINLHFFLLMRLLIPSIFYVGLVEFVSAFCDWSCGA
jgi:hypothetical protein